MRSEPARGTCDYLASQVYRTENYGRSRKTLATIDRAKSENQAVALDVYPYIASSTSLLPRFIEGCEAVLVAESTPHPGAMIGSDGLASMQTPHPRLWGTFPRVLGYYVREKKLLGLETADTR